MSLLKHLLPDFNLFDNRLKKIAPVGYTLAVNIKVAIPEFYHTTLPEDWVNEYLEKKYVFIDPIMTFTAFSQGVKRWSELSTKVPLSAAVMEGAKNYNLNYGCAVVKKGRGFTSGKHLLSVARSDRELTDAEIVDLATLFEEVLSKIHPEEHLTDRQIQILQLSAKGLNRNQIAEKLSMSSETIKTDMAQVRSMWKAKNWTAAVAIAVQRRLVVPYGDTMF